MGSAFGSKITFVSITVDPERDTPEALKQYADNFGADLRGWAFLTGDPSKVVDVGHRYGVFARKTATGEVDHTFLRVGFETHVDLAVRRTRSMMEAA